MLFKPQHIPMILSGQKTATRRTWKKCPVKLGGIYKCKTKMLSKDYFAKVKVTGLFQQPLGAMSYKDANKEGYFSFGDFISIWEEINGVWNPKLRVWVVEFELVKKDKS